MNKINELIDKYYDKFVGLPNGKPIVRENQKDDAFEIVVLETLYGKELGIDVSRMNSSDILSISKYIVAPPDAGIDIVVVKEEIDGNSFDFVQVKNSDLSQLDIQQAMSYMERSISQYLKKRTNVNENLRQVLSDLGFSAEDKSNCRYLVVHRGQKNYFKGQKENKEIVVTESELLLIRDGMNSAVPRVHKESFEADAFNNFIIYEESRENPAILMNICGYDLACLANKYANTSLGRNILFGQNLRDSLTKSKTYDGMASTIREEPEKFWFYNNGITVIAENYDTIPDPDDSERVERLILEEFSIINGAQTTSALGRFLKEADMNACQEDIDQLKKVFVLARVLKVIDDDFRAKIAIYNNTQNPITTRDMASNREEQLQLYNGLLNGESPNIYVEIRRGTTPPPDVKLYKHQKTTNVELAQLAFAGFFRNPFIAKDKKNSIFDTDYKQTDYLINEYYHKLFNYVPEESEKGILFKKSKEDINELLFVHYLYNAAKKNLVAGYKNRINDAEEQLDRCDDDNERKRIEKRISDYERLKTITNVCVFYCIAYYYGFKEEFPNADSEKAFKFKEFYSDKEFQDKMIESFRDLFLTPTIEIIKEFVSNMPNLNTWIRDKKSTPAFLEKVTDKIQMDVSLESKYKEFINNYKE